MAQVNDDLENATLVSIDSGDGKIEAEITIVADLDSRFGYFDDRQEVLDSIESETEALTQALETNFTNFDVEEVNVQTHTSPPTIVPSNN